MFKRIAAIFLAILLVAALAVTSVSAEGNAALNRNQKVSFTAACADAGYVFNLYKVADFAYSDVSPYEMKYTSTISSITDEIASGDPAALLVALDALSSSQLGSPVDSYSVDSYGTSKTFNNLDQGIYYVRAVNFPANVKAVTNSVFSLPYYTADNGWVYTIDTIPLADKTDETNPGIHQIITNPTRSNENFTDVSLGDTVNFKVTADTVGAYTNVDSLNMALSKYEITETIGSGLTADIDSVVVKLTNAAGEPIRTLAATEYTKTLSDGVMKIALKESVLSSEGFYAADKVTVDYSAVLNASSTFGAAGNPDTATSLVYANKTGVEDTVDGNTVYAYTYGVEVTKYTDAGQALAGSSFALYATAADAQAQRNALATGTSGNDGKVIFKNTSDEVIRLESGTYYIVETAATQDYNRYTDVIEVAVTATYGESFANGTWVTSQPDNGIQQIEVKNSKVIIPNTGGEGGAYRYVIAGAALLLAIFAAAMIISKKNKVSAK